MSVMSRTLNPAVASRIDMAPSVALLLASYALHSAMPAMKAVMQQLKSGLMGVV